MQHHQTPTARALKLSVAMVALLFGSASQARAATIAALISRGLQVKDATGAYVLTDAGREAMARMEAETLDEDEAPTPVRRTDPGTAAGDPSGAVTSGRRIIRARDVKPGMTIGVVQSGEPDREVVVTDVREIGTGTVIKAGTVEVSTGPLTLFSLLNDGSLFEVPDSDPSPRGGTVLGSFEADPIAC